MLGAATLFRVKAPVPGLQRAMNAVPGQHRLQDLRIGQRLGARRLPDPHQQPAHGIGRLGHFRFQLVGGETGIAQQFCPLMAQRQRLGRHGPVVMGIAIGAARDPGPIGQSAQLAVGGKLQEGHDQRPVQRDSRSVQPALAPRRPRRRDNEIGQARQILLGQRQMPAAFLGQHILAELGAQGRQPRHHRRHPVTLRAAQLGPRAHEHPPVQIQHPALLMT